SQEDSMAAGHKAFGRARLATILVASAATVALAAAPVAEAKSRDFTGIVSEDVFAGDAGYREAQLTLQQQLGFRLTRQTFRWSDIEISPGNYDFSYYDGYVAALARHGMRVLPILFG